MSDNAVVPGAGLLDVGAVFVVLGSAALLADVLAVGCGPLMAPTGAWCAELIVAALFPIGRPNTAMSLSGTVHRVIVRHRAPLRRSDHVTGLPAIAWAISARSVKPRSGTTTPPLCDVSR